MIYLAVCLEELSGAHELTLEELEGFDRLAFWALGEHVDGLWLEVDRLVSGAAEEFVQVDAAQICPARPFDRFSRS